MEVNNLDKLVSVVTNNILEKMDVKNNPSLKENSCLILIPDVIFGFRDYINYIKKEYSKFDLYLGSHSELAETFNIENGYNLTFDVRNNEFITLLDAVSTIIIIGPKIEVLRSLAQTDDNDDVNHVILGSLMANKSVNILLNTNGLMFSKIANIINEVRQLGINITNIQHGNNTLDKVELITERYVMNLKDNGLKVITFDKEQLITPLAKDKLSEYKIKIEYNKEAK